MDDAPAKPASQLPDLASTWFVSSRFWTARMSGTKFPLLSFLVLSACFPLIKHPAWLSLKYSASRLIHICNWGPLWSSQHFSQQNGNKHIPYCTVRDCMPRHKPGFGFG